MLVSLRALPAWVGGGLLADLHRASPSAASAPAASVSASSCPGRRGRVGARSVARAVLGVLRRDGLRVLAMPRGSHAVCASGNLSHWIQQVKEKETDTPRKTPGGARHAATARVRQGVLPVRARAPAGCSASLRVLVGRILDKGPRLHEFHTTISRAPLHQLRRLNLHHQPASGRPQDSRPQAPLADQVQWRLRGQQVRHQRERRARR